MNLINFGNYQLGNCMSTINIETSHSKQKPILFTGITPTGTLTIGHYLGVIRHLISMQESYQIFLMIADLHALTTTSSQEIDFKAKAHELAALVYACGLQKENCYVFVQSEVKEHVELSYLLSSYCTVSRLTNMIQYKEKSLEKKSASVSLLYYPVLMAADILLYDAELVMVGKDQKQHLELTTYLANKFNATNNKVLKIPNFSIANFGSKIMALKNPTKKMSKSGNDYLAILDDRDSVKKKIMRAETDSEEKVYYDLVNKPGISNLLTIYACFENLQVSEVDKLFTKASYAQLKEAVAEVVSTKLSEIQSAYQLHRRDIASLVAANNLKIRKIAALRIQEIKKQVGI